MILILLPGDLIARIVDWREDSLVLFYLTTSEKPHPFQKIAVSFTGGIVFLVQGEDFEVTDDFERLRDCEHRWRQATLRLTRPIEW